MSRDGLSGLPAGVWHRDSAAASLERWQQVSAAEGWGEVPRDRAALARVFGASWFFTRYLFFRGPEAAQLIDAVAAGGTAELEAGWRELEQFDCNGDAEQRVEQLRLLKNGIMLRVLLLWLDGRLGQEQAEAALTRLAEQVLRLLLALLVFTDGTIQRAAVLGMGRLAGAEMNFGSDLDLVFLHDSPSGHDPGTLPRHVRSLLRHIAAASPAGSLYEVDMRLRPHGTSGALITSVAAFAEYHAGARETWERQMMTRCRPVCDPQGVGARAMQQLLPRIYAPHPAPALREEIRGMRLRVERELGRPQGRSEVKRGRGGLMDLDFIAHYLQLAHGHEHRELRTCSTRGALRAAAAAGLLDAAAAVELLAAYDWLKRVEACLRLFDMKSVSSFRNESASLAPLAYGMNCDGDGARFLEAYRARTDAVRAQFEAVLGML